jgi:hypothetical protein
MYRVALTAHEPCSLSVSNPEIRPINPIELDDST